LMFFLGLTNLMLANKLSGSLVLRRAAPLSVIPVIILLVAFNPLASPWLSVDPSTKSLARQVDQIEYHLPASEFFVLSTNRNQKFGLSFYLHRDIQFWDPENPKEGFLLLRSSATAGDCESYVKATWYCSEKSMEMGPTGWVAYRVHRPRSKSPDQKN